MSNLINFHNSWAITMFTEQKYITLLILMIDLFNESMYLSFSKMAAAFLTQASRQI